MARWLVAVVFAALAGCATRPTSTSTHSWGKPCDDCMPGVHNFSRVSDRLWRGSQPDTKDPDVFRKLAAAGVKTVINLRHDHDDYPALKGTNLHYLWVPMRAFQPREDEVVMVLAGLRRALADPSLWPVYVHCAEGKDRTGYVIASYRIIEEQWDADSAIQEMFDFRFNTAWILNPGFLHRLAAHRQDIATRVTQSP